MENISSQPHTDGADSREEKIVELKQMIRATENRLRNLSISSRCFFDTGRLPGFNKVPLELAGSDMKGQKAVRSSLLRDYKQVQDEYKRILASETERVQQWKRRYASLLENNAGMSKVKFLEEAIEAERELGGVFAILNSRFIEQACNLPGRFIESVDIRDLDAFLTLLSLKFIPRKEEIARILAVAKKIHEERYSGASGKKQPIRIADIGGGNGFLGKLVTDIAKENSLAIEYVVVDPDISLVEEAAEFYKGNASLKFVKGTGEDLERTQFDKDPEMLRLFNDRRALILEGETKRRAMLTIIEEIAFKKMGALTPESIREYLSVIKVNFGLDLPGALALDAEAFRNEFNRKVCLKAWLWTKELRERIEDMTVEIEKGLATRPVLWDLVICSWMPIDMDLTKQVRETGGAAILYVLDRYGATGCRSDALYGEYPERFGEEESFNPGLLYESRLGWIGHSTPEVVHMKELGHSQFWNNDREDNPAFGNAFIIQVRKTKKETYSLRADDIDPKKSGIAVKGVYSWEKELVEKGGGISPVVRLRDENGVLNYFAAFSKLAEWLEARQSKGPQGFFKRIISSVSSFF